MNMRIFCIDRFEEDLAVLEARDGKTFAVIRSVIPDGAREGDILVFNGRRYFIDREETKRRTAHIDELMRKLFEKKL